MIYHYETRSRKPAAIAWVVVVAAFIVFLYVTIDLASWLAVFFAACLLPACWDIIQDRRASLDLSQGRVIWSLGAQNGDRADIDHVRLTRRLDGTLKITLVHINGSKTRLPPDISPPIRPFEDALEKAEIRAERHPFALA